MEYFDRRGTILRLDVFDTLLFKQNLTTQTPLKVTSLSLLKSKTTALHLSTNMFMDFCISPKREPIHGRHFKECSYFSLRSRILLLFFLIKMSYFSNLRQLTFFRI